MGERKVLNKYIPPDFDPALIPRGKKLSAKDGTVPVRMMLPFTAQCATCNTFLYRGTKFNSKKEAMGGPDGTYLGITRWRFYIKCTCCARPLTFLTDPKNADYEMESGGTRNYEVYKDKAETEEAAIVDQAEEEKLDPMKALENRVLDSQREMQEMASLEAIRAMNTRHVHLLLSNGRNDLLGGTLDLGGPDDDNGAADKGAAKDELLTQEDEALIKSIQFGAGTSRMSAQPESLFSNDLRRLDERDEERLEQERKRTLRQLEEQQKAVLDRASAHAGKKSVTMPVIVAKRKRVVPSNVVPAATVAKEGAGKQETGTDGSKTPPTTLPQPPRDNNSTGSGGVAAAGGLSSLLGGYGSDDDSDNE
jgi:Saf4/Yju2 protein